MHLQLSYQHLQICCLPGLLALCVGSSVMKFCLIWSTDLPPCSVVVRSSRRLRTNHLLFCTKALLSGAFWMFPGPIHPFLSSYPPKACFCFLSSSWELPMNKLPVMDSEYRTVLQVGEGLSPAFTGIINHPLSRAFCFCYFTSGSHFPDCQRGIKRILSSEGCLQVKADNARKAFNT